MTFIGGPCSQGPGMVVDDELKNPIRFVSQSLCLLLKLLARLVGY